MFSEYVRAEERLLFFITLFRDRKACASIYRFTLKMKRIWSFETSGISDTPYDSYLQQTDVRTSRLTTDCVW